MQENTECKEWEILGVGLYNLFGDHMDCPVRWRGGASKKREEKKSSFENIDTASVFEYTIIRGTFENVNIDIFCCTSLIIYYMALGILIFSYVLPLHKIEKFCNNGSIIFTKKFNQFNTIKIQL